MYDRDKLNTMVPEHLRDGLARYIDERVEPGHFLMWVLENDLFNAVASADEESRAGLLDLVRFIYNYAPSQCWGSKAKVEEWLR